MAKNNSWFKLSTIKPGCNPEAMFGCTEFRNERDYLYPVRMLKPGSATIWIPSKKVHICVASYVDAFRNNDETAIARLSELGIPAGVNFGYGPEDDLTCMYDVKKEQKPRAKKKDSVKVMRARHAAEFDDGTKFKPGDVVKILFRKQFVEDRGGAKRFRNLYVKPTREEIDEFIRSEKGVA